MHRLLLAGAIVALATWLATASAWATEVATASPAGSITATSLESLTFTSREGLINPTIRCPVTLNGSLDEEADNSTESVFGEITSGSVGTCSTGTVSAVFEELANWPLILTAATDYSRSPTSIAFKLSGVQVSFTVSGITCLYVGEMPVTLAASGSPLRTELMTLGANTLRLLAGGAFCPASGSLSGRLAVTQQTVAGARLPLSAFHENEAWGRTTSEREFTFTNVSGGNVTIGSVGLRQSKAGFQITSRGCLEAMDMPKTIANNATCRVRVKFTTNIVPGGLGILEEDRLELRETNARTLLGLAGVSGVRNFP